MNHAGKSIYDRLPCLIKSADVSLIPEGLVGYLLGPALALSTNAVLTAYLNKYMSDVLDINSWAAGFFKWLPVVSVIFVVIGNILVGRLMDQNTTAAGKARPLLLLSLPICILALVILFVLSPFSTDTINTSRHGLTLVCVAAGYILWFAAAYPMYYTPHSAMINLSTHNSDSRTLLSTVSNGASLAAIGLAGMVLPFFLPRLFVYDLSGSGTPVLNDAGVIEYYTNENGATLYDARASYEHWKIFVIALAAVTVLGVLIEFMFTRERVTEEAMHSGNVSDKKAPSFVRQAGICLRDRSWIIMMVFFFCYQLGGTLKIVSQNFFCQAMFADGNGNYTVAMGGRMEGTFNMIVAIPTVAGMILAPMLARRIGKRKAILLGGIIAVCGGALGMTSPSDPAIVIVSLVIKALGSTPSMYLALALLGDILDQQERHYSIRTDGLSMTVYGAIMAGMTGLATGILNIVLSHAGYSPVNLSSEALRSALPWIFIGGETCCYAIIVIIVFFMRVEKCSK